MTNVNVFDILLLGYGGLTIAWFWVSWKIYTVVYPLISELESTRSTNISLEESNKTLGENLARSDAKNQELQTKLAETNTKLVETQARLSETNTKLDNCTIALTT
jgi:chromosome segregation ATPase